MEDIDPVGGGVPSPAYGVVRYSTVGYLGDTAKTPKESPSL
ncbi:MAG: hypothetical protein PUP92_20510 [Rhizonema sp. PD38]|nr:hypothetical protein [Rhizonema sp. PD38]